MSPDILALVLSAGAVGAVIGSFTGIVPGIHVNTLAAMMVAAYPAICGMLSGCVPSEYVPVMVSCCIMSASVVHSFVDFVPSAFIGAPDADEALSVLPAHRLLLMGEGMTAVRAAAVGSAVGAVTALVLAIPLQWVLLKGAGTLLDSITLGVIAVTLAAIVIGSGNRLASLTLVLLSGALGLTVMNMGIPSSGVLGTGTLLFPMLTGLFGIPPLLERAGSARIPQQVDCGRDPVGPGPGLKGVLTGCIAGWFPGITATAAASLACVFSRDSDPARFISLTSSIGTVTAVFSVVTLSVSGSGRSGTSLAVKGIIGDGLGGFCSDAFVLVLFSIAAAAAIGYAVTIAAGKAMSKLVDAIPAEPLGNAVLALIFVLVLLLTGPWGTAVLVVSALIGTLPPRFGVARVCLAACLMVPAAMFQTGLSQAVCSMLGWPLRSVKLIICRRITVGSICKRPC